MFIRSLKLYQFRNLQDGTYLFGPGVNVILGKNGQGKTNLIEAINFLSLARSFRTSSLQELNRWGESSCSVFAEIEQGDTQFEIGVAIEKKTKSGFLNGDRVKSLTEYVGRLMCVSFSPGDLTLVQGAPQERRRFIDRHIADLNQGFMGHTLSYHRALKSKNKLLKEENVQPEMLEPWNQILAREGAYVLDARRRFLEQLEEKARAVHEVFGPNDGVLSLTLQSTMVKEASGSYQELLELFEKNMAREIAYRRSLIGPHRDDVGIALDGHPSRSYASQGQSRSIVLSLKLAVIDLLEEQRNESPVVLLDDVDSELDSERRARFFELLKEKRIQIFITGTEDRTGLPLGSAQSRSFQMCSGLLSEPNCN